MKKSETSRHSLVAFLQSIKFKQARDTSEHCETPFARPVSHTHQSQRSEDCHLVRSAN